MLVKKIIKEFVLSEKDKQTIKNNAQEIRNYITKMGVDKLTPIAKAFLIYIATMRYILF